MLCFFNYGSLLIGAQYPYVVLNGRNVPATIFQIVLESHCIQRPLPFEESMKSVLRAPMADTGRDEKTNFPKRPSAARTTDGQSDITYLISLVGKRGYFMFSVFVFLDLTQPRSNNAIRTRPLRCVGFDGTRHRSGQKPNKFRDKLRLSLLRNKRTITLHDIYLTPTRI